MPPESRLLVIRRMIGNNHSVFVPKQFVWRRKVKLEEKWLLRAKFQNLVRAHPFGLIRKCAGWGNHVRRFSVCTTNIDAFGHKAHDSQQPLGVEIYVEILAIWQPVARTKVFEGVAKSLRMLPGSV